MDSIDIKELFAELGRLYVIAKKQSETIDILMKERQESKEATSPDET